MEDFKKRRKVDEGSAKPKTLQLNPENTICSFQVCFASRKLVGRDREVPREETDSVGLKKRRRSLGSDNKSVKPNTSHFNPVNPISYVQILGTGMDTQDTSPSVLLFFDKQRFIFNAGEGLQRFCAEHKIKLSKIDRIFLSRVCSETAGGLPGLLLTLAGMVEEGISVNIWGPSDLKYLVDAMQPLICNAAMAIKPSFEPMLGPIETAMVNQSGFTDPIVLIDNEVVKILAILLQPNMLEGSQPLSQESMMTISSEEVLKERMDFMLNSNNLKANSSTGKPGNVSVVYVCELPEIRGKFDPEKAVALGLKPGPKYRELQLGNSVKSDLQNIMVHPTDVMGPSVPGPVVLIVDCPTKSHLQELLSIQYLSSYFADFSCQLESGKAVTCIIHLSPASIVSDSSYQKWMDRFGAAQHIMAGYERKNMEIPILKSSARVTARLNYLCPQLFPAPGFMSLNNLEGSVLKLCESISAKNLLKFVLRPYAHLGLDRSCIPSSMAPLEIIDELLSEIPDIVDAAKHVSQLWKGSKETNGNISVMQDDRVMVEEPWNENTLPSCLENTRRDDLEIVFLGTGSSQPSKYRNVSSIYINLFSKGGLLLDCGEGSLGQLKRRYGEEGADNVVRGLRCIWISHIHADHNAGLARILAVRCDLLKGTPHEPILVIGPRQLKRYLDAFQIIEDFDMQFLDCNDTTEASWYALESAAESNQGNYSSGVEFNDITIENRDMQRPRKILSDKGFCIDVAITVKNLKKMLGEAGLEALISFPVLHCPQAFGVVLKAAERTNSVGKVIPGWKIVYSGDTRPCPRLIEASHGSTVLIHEATFEDGMEGEAIAKHHSTTKEAIEVGNSAGAYRIILTHFSQRYPKIPVFDETHMHNTCIAFDLMSINVADLPMLPKVVPYLKLLFRNEIMVDDSDVIIDAVHAES